MILAEGRDGRIKWRTLNMGPFRDKEIGELSYGIASSALRAFSQWRVGVIVT